MKKKERLKLPKPVPFDGETKISFGEYEPPSELKQKSLQNIARTYGYDLDDVVGWLKAEMLDMLDEEICKACDGPFIYGEGNFVVERDSETGRWQTKRKPNYTCQNPQCPKMGMCGGACARNF